MLAFSIMFFSGALLCFLLAGPMASATAKPTYTFLRPAVGSSRPRF